MAICASIHGNPNKFLDIMNSSESLYLYIYIYNLNNMGEKKVDRFIFKISDKLGKGSYGEVTMINSPRSIKV
mgnify:CR=1 FL=1